LLVSVLQLLLPRSTEERIISWLVDRLRLSGDLDESIQNAVADVSTAASVAGLVSLVILLWAASGMMGAIRSAFRALWRADAPRPYLRGKLLDAALVLGAGVLVVTAFGLTVIAQSLTRIGDELAEELGLGDPGEVLGEFAELGVSAILTFTALFVLYRTMPPVRVGLVDASIGSLVGMVGVLLATAGFSFYLDHLAGFDDIFGPLGAILVFIYLVYVLAAILLFAAGVAAAWPSTREPPPPGPRTPLRGALLGLLRGLVFPRQPDSKDERGPG
jgi:membrane protein